MSVLDMVESDKIYQFKKKLRQLREFRGSGTELISVYIQADSPLHETTNKLREEMSQASNIKSKSTRTNVTGALERIIGYLKIYKSTPEKGIAVFCGNISENTAKVDIELFAVEPIQTLNIGAYRCDSKFFLEPFERMVNSKDSYGIVVMDGREATLAIVFGSEITIVQRLNSTAHQKINKGGQCLAPETLVQKSDGDICEIRELTAGSKIKATDLNNNKVKDFICSDIFKTTTKEYYVIKTSAPATVIEATPYHRFFVTSEHGINEKYAKNLRIGDMVLFARRVIHRGRSIKTGIENIKLTSNTIGRSIPKKIMRSKNSVCAAFLRGIFDAKGDIHKGIITITSKSKKLMQQCQILLLRLGVLSSFNEKKVFSNPHWDITITDLNSLRNFRKHIGFSRTDKATKLENICGKRANNVKVKHVRNVLYSIYAGDLIISKVSKKTKIRKRRDFYDLTIPIASNFLANGLIVHNSQRRYQRLIEESIERYYKRVGEAIDTHFLTRVKGVIVGGPGPTKEMFMKMKPFNYQIRVLGVVDTGYTDEYGVREVLAKSDSILTEQEAIKEKQIIDCFMKEVVTDGLVTYGKKEVEEAIKIKQAERVLLSEDVESALLDYFVELAREKGIEVEIISTKTSDGAQFFGGFGGIGAFLRYRR